MTMSTETAAEQQQLMIATPNGFEQIERNRFNTGPYANRTMPTQCVSLLFVLLDESNRKNGESQ
jgi:hypothetical protein